jgi:hypothetical protein
MDSLWNEPQRLDPKKFLKYSEKNIDPDSTLKKTITNLSAIVQREREEDFENRSQRLSFERQQHTDRYLARKLER